MSEAPPAPFGEPPSWLRETDGELAVLGADGFIGSHVVAAALAAGARVTALTVNDPWRLDGLEHPRLRLEAVGRRWWDAPRTLDGASALVLLAYTPPPSRDLGEWGRHEEEINVSGSVRWAAAAGARVIFASSADVYGLWADSPAAESAEPDPATPYAAAKLRAEERVAGAAPTVVLRIATVYGPLERGPRAIPSFIRAFASGERPRIHNGGTDVRDYVQVGDIAAAVVNAAYAPAEATLNVGSGVGRTTREVLEAVAAAMGTAADPVDEPTTRPPTRLVVDPAAARAALAFAPDGDFATHVANEAAWLSAHL